MRYSAINLMFAPDLSDEALVQFDRAARLGLDGIEFLIPEPAEFPAQTIQRRSAETGVRAETFAFLLDQAHNVIDPDPALRAAGVRRLKEAIHVVAGMGGTLLSGAIHAPYAHFSGAMPTEEEWHRSAEALHQAGEYAAQQGIRLGVEPINRYKMYFINTVADGRRLVDSVGLDNVGLVIDTFHMNMEEKDLPAAILTAGDRLYNIHLNENDRGIPGTGHIPWDEVFGALRSIGYDDWAMMESFVPDMPGVASRFTAWRRLAPSTEALVSEGLRYFREKE